MTKTVIGLYDDLADAQRAIQELLRNGFTGEHISVVTNKTAGTANATGAIIASLAELSKATVPGIGPTVAAGPLFNRQPAESDGEVGDLLDVFLSAGVPWERSHCYVEGIRRGGTLVMVRPPDDLAVRAVQVIHHYGPVDLDHRVKQWRENGWRHFAMGANPDPTSRVEREPRLDRQITEARY